MFNVTYEIITHESAEHGEAAEHGFVLEDGTLREAVDAMERRGVSPSCWPWDGEHVWFSTIDGDVDYRTGETEYRAFHMPENLTPSTRRRIARLLGMAI